jgi:segregation and condensation protein A
MGEQDLDVAGEFFVMAATLLEIKTRMLLPKPVTDEISDEEGEDPRAALVERLQEYEKFKALAANLQFYEEARNELFIRDQASYNGLYELPVRFGQVSAEALLKALTTLLEDADDDGEESVTSVRRQKMSLKIALRALAGLVKEAGHKGLDFRKAFPENAHRLDVIMTFLAMLELLRQGKLFVTQKETLGEIRLYGFEEDAF